MTRPALVVTGAIGAGKSALARALGETGPDTVDADRIGHQVLAAGSPVNREVVQRWPQVLSPAGEIDRRALGAIVFSSRRELEALEGMIHPAIRAALAAKLQSDGPALVIDLSVPKVLDSDPIMGNLPVVVVDAPADLRRRRLVARGLEESEITSRMGAQPSRGEWLQLADLVVPNHGDLASLRSVAPLVLTWFRARRH